MKNSTLYKFATTYKGLLRPIVNDDYVIYYGVSKTYGDKEVILINDFAKENGVPVSAKYNGNSIIVSELTGLDRTEFNLGYASYKLGKLHSELTNAGY